MPRLRLKARKDSHDAVMGSKIKRHASCINFELSFSTTCFALWVFLYFRA
jgi:hypothetical protein